MHRYRCAVITLFLVGTIVLGAGRGWTDERTRQTPDPGRQQLLDRLNNRPAAREHHRWGIFLGTTWSAEQLWRIKAWQREGKWVNPFTGQPFADAPVFVFGHDNPVLEGLRVASDHLGIHVLSSWEELEGQYFDFVLCHSNGCTNAMDAHRRGIIHVEHFMALGTDWTSKDFAPGDLQGATIVFFAMASDPIWKLPAPNLVRTRDGGAVQFSVPFDHLSDIPKGFVNLFTQGRADQERFPVVRLEPPPGQKGTLRRPFKAHLMVDVYFPALRRWMGTEGPLQKELATEIRQTEAINSPYEQKKTAPLPPGGGGGGGGTGSPGNSLQGPGSGIVPYTPGTTPPGGILMDIRINPGDFQTQ